MRWLLFCLLWPIVAWAAYNGPASSAAVNGYTTWLNQGNASEVDTAQGMSFNLPSQGNAHVVNGLIKAAPATPYTVTMLLIWGGVPTQLNDANAIIGWYDGTSAVDAIAINPYAGLLSYSHNTYASYSAPVNAPTPTASCPLWDRLAFGECSNPAMQPIVPPSHFVWVMLANTGTTISVALALDGQNYQTLWSFPAASGFLSAGYNDLIIGGDAHLAQALFTISSYSD
jgi:hypothetical protein